MEYLSLGQALILNITVFTDGAVEIIRLQVRTVISTCYFSPGLGFHYSTVL